MTRTLVIAALVFGLGAPAFAQLEAHGAPPATPQKSAPQPLQEAPPSEPQARSPGQTSGDQTLSTGRSKNTDGETIPPPEPGNDVPPDAPTDYAADAFYSTAEMDRARGILDAEHGGARVSKFMVNELEYARASGEGGYRWDGEAWYGGDTHRLVLKSEGEGESDLDKAEIQALYSRAIGPYTDLQLGLRHDIEPQPDGTYLAVGVETLLPYWFEVGGALFAAERGQVLGRLEGRYDLMLTQRLVLQPNAEINLALKDDSDISVGSGLSDAAVGLRLRYEITREFAPYVGILWERKFGDTADFARANGDEQEATMFVAGLRAWF